jgi:hypothetical protein
VVVQDCEELVLASMPSDEAVAPSSHISLRDLRDA